MPRGARLASLLPAVLLALAAPADLNAAIEQTEFRRPQNPAELEYWLLSMRDLHRYTPAEMMVALGLDKVELEDVLRRLPPPVPLPSAADRERLLVAPYPGGRHPRIGFRDGAVRPQRETKASVFPPWEDGGYLVLDAPEAIWRGDELLYLAHTHVPTLWDKRRIKLERLEWSRNADGSLEVERPLPNHVSFGAHIAPGRDAVEIRLWLRNSGDERLTGLRAQLCAMLGRLKGFEAQSNDNKIFDPPYAACRSDDGRRWVVLEAAPLHRAWGNPPCPCLHADPVFPDCEPGETARVRARLSFHETDDVRAVLRGLEASRERPAPAEPLIESSRE